MRIPTVSAPVLLAFALTAACGTSGPEGGAPPGGMPPMAVETVTLAPAPAERASEYVATVKSRRSSTVQPQVEGFVTRIHVQPGQRVSRGTALLQIDAGRQQAAVAGIESLRAARQADVQLARQQAERSKTLLAGGAISAEQHERVVAALATAEAQLRAIDAQIREQRLELGYHTVTAQAAGLVGDIPVRVGDRVTRGTVLTTIDEAAGLELYISVPVQQAQGLKPGVRVQVLDATGADVGATAIDFVASSVDPATQSVLAKAPLRSSVSFRPDQAARVRVVWSAEPALTVPLVAVTRLNGQHFVFVAEAADGGFVARQRAVQLGDLVGNDYLVLGGLSAGEQLIVAGAQKLADGAPVQPAPAAGSR